MRSSSERGGVVLLLLLLIVVCGFVYWYVRPAPTGGSASPAVGTSGTRQQDDERAREKGREIGEKVAVGAERLKGDLAQATLTGKIKAKMALDDTVKARAIDVTTNGSVVTLSGRVGSAAEHDRAVALARETSGVSKVVDHLTVTSR
jgi:hyperosmotically inducible protein